MKIIASSGARQLACTPSLVRRGSASGFLALALLVVAATTGSLRASNFYPSLTAASPFSYLSLGETPTALPGSASLKTAVDGGTSAAVDFFSMGESASTASAYGFTLLTTNPFFNQSIVGTTTITLTGSGKYVLKLSDVNLSNNAILTINAPAGARIVFDIAGVFSLNQSRIQLAGGVSASNVVFNLTNPTQSTAPTTLGKVVNSQIAGSILARSRDVVLLGNSTVNQQVVSRNVSVAPGTTGLGNLAPSLSKASAFSLLSLSQPALEISNTAPLKDAVTGAGQAAVDFYSMGESAPTATAFGYSLLSSNPLFNQPINGTTTISLIGSGKYVMKLASLDLENGAILTINAPAGARVVFDIAGVFVIDQSQIVLSGGILAKNVLFNLTNPTGNKGPSSLGRVSNSTVNASVLARSRDVVVSGASTIKGQVIASTVSIEGPVIVSPEF